MKNYMHAESGDVATERQWRNDYDAMDVETWFGLPVEECNGLHWLDDQPHLVEVNLVEGEWVEV